MPGGSQSEGEDSDFDVDERPKDYMMNDSERVINEAHQRAVKVGIKRHPGHYVLGTLRNTPVDGSLEHFYNGKHWDVDFPTDRCLERSTRRLTIQAVHKSLDIEQARRMQEEDQTRKRASITLQPLNNEFKNAIAVNQEEHKKKIKADILVQEELKDEAQAELIWNSNKMDLEEQMEEERERRVSIMDAMIHGDREETDKEFKAVVKAMADINVQWVSVQDDLMSAWAELDDVRNEEDHDIDDRYKDIKDSFVSSFNRASNLIKLQVSEEAEKRRRSSICKDPNMAYDRKRKRSMFLKELTQAEMIRMFAGVQLDEAIKEETTHEEARKAKEELMMAMIRDYNIKLADHSMCEEKARRIREIELDQDEIDFLKERVKDVMANVQDEMLIQKFHGHKVTDNIQEQDVFYDAESERDGKLRSMRLKARRKSCVVTDDF